MSFFKDHIHFCDELSERVKVFTKGGKFVGEGDLKISSKIMPSVGFDLGVKLKLFRKNTYFLCKSPRGEITLLNSEVRGFDIYPGLIVKGHKANSRFKKISILLQGVSEWMDNSWGGEITKDEIKKTRETEVFNVTVKERLNN